MTDNPLGPSPWGDGADYRIRKCRATHLETKKDDKLKNWEKCMGILISFLKVLSSEMDPAEIRLIR